MKQMNIKRAALALGVFATLLTGCSKGISDFGNINRNPNATTVPITSALLMQVVMYGAVVSIPPPDCIVSTCRKHSTQISLVMLLLL
jgi:hypothetical protein